MKISKIITSALGVLMMTGCALDINDDPNYASGSDITPSLQFPAVVNSVATCIGDQMFTYGGFFSQYFEQRPEANQYNNLAEYNIDESSDLFNRVYRTLYAGALMDIKDVQGKTSNTADLLALQVMRTLSFQLLVDNTDQTPFSEALDPSATVAPKYDEGQDVYLAVLDELDQAEAALATNSMSMTDPVFNGDVAQWKGFANALRLRMYLRLIDGNVNASEYTSKVKALIAAGEFFTGDVKWDVYQNVVGQYNPWYGGIVDLNTNNFCAAYPIVEYMKSTSDPRIGYSISPRTQDGTYVGQLPGAKQSNDIYSTSGYKNPQVSAINTASSADAPIYFYTQAELQLLIAEAELRFNSNAAAAKAAYEAGVKADFESRGVSGADDFLANEASFDAQASNDDKLNLIYMQKWVALLMRDHMEAWSEIRRTDVPKMSAKTAKQINDNVAEYTVGELIEPYVNYEAGVVTSFKGQIAKSLPYASYSRRYNQNTPAARRLSTPVFWDVK